MSVSQPPQPPAPPVEKPTWAPRRKAGVSTPRAFDFDVAIVGLGYVGLPTALAFHAAGHRVLGVDVSVRRLSIIRDQRADLLETDRERLRDALGGIDFEMITDVTRISTAAAVIICVPTTVDEYLIPDLRILEEACTQVVQAAVPGQVLLLASSSYVGTTHDMLVAPLVARGFVVGTDIYVAFSADRIDPGNDRHALEDVARVIGGATRTCADKAAVVLRGYARNVHTVSSAEEAEMTKLLENVFRAVNLALANEMAEICNLMGLNVMNVIGAAATKPYGFMPFFPGPGVGGQRIPVDPQHLLWQLRRNRWSSPLIEQAMTGIALRPRRVVSRIRETLSDRGLGLTGSRLLVVGVAYKPDIEDARDSTAREIVSELITQGATVGYYDPLIPTLTLHDGTTLVGVDDPANFGADLVLVHTAHHSVSLEWLVDQPIVLDATYRLTGLPNRVVL